MQKFEGRCLHAPRMHSRRPRRFPRPRCEISCAAGQNAIGTLFDWNQQFSLCGWRFVRIAPTFGLAFDVRYIDYGPTSTSEATGASEDLELSPLVTSLGLRVRF